MPKRIPMLVNYLKIAWRNLVRNKIYSAINIGGLSIGIAVCLLIALYMTHEYSYDSFHKNAGSIYSVNTRMKLGGGGDTINYPYLNYPTGPALMRANPSVENFLRIKIPSFEPVIVENPGSLEKRFSEKKFLFADSNFFNFFSFRLKAGNPMQVLARPFTVVISERAAKKYFGNADPVGRLLKCDSAYTFEITGVAQNAPSNSTIDYDFVASLSSSLSMKDGKQFLEEQDIWIGPFWTFLQLKKGASYQNLETSINKMVAQNKVGTKESGRWGLLPLPATHLFYEGMGSGNTKYLSIFMLVGILILLLALINYMNLATARSTLRAKEIGIRKVIGANRPKIAGQFYVESTLYALISFVVGTILFRLAQPYFFNRIQLSVDPSFFYQPRVLGIFGALLLLTILVAGSYPSVVLSTGNPIAVLYGKLSRQRSGVGLRRFFIVLQFSISVGMIIGSLVIERQMYFFRHTDTGVDRENVLMVPFQSSIRDHYQAFKNEVRNVSGVRQVATAVYPMYKGLYTLSATSPGNNVKHALSALTVDDQFMSLLNLQWLIPPKGNSIFSNDKHVLLNKVAIGQLDLPADPVGGFIHIGNDKYAIGGVVKNFNYTSLHNKIDAFALFVTRDSSMGWGADINGCLFVKIGQQVNIPTMIGSIQQIYNKYDQQTPFESEFLDDAFNAGYKAEDRLAGIFGLFTGLMIVIACLGLFGMVAFSVTERTREIGIRKVLGASVQGIVALLTKDFALYIFIAILIAIPVTFYGMNRWLENFAYKINMGWEIFSLAGVLTIILALLTISGVAIRAAKANPVKNLRTE